MTTLFWLWMAAAALALSGTRLSAVAFAAVAAAAAVDGGAGGAVAAWIPITAGALVVLGRPPRRLAVPAVGALAALVAVRSPNAAAAIPAWSVAAACAASVAAGSVPGTVRRWALGSLGADAVVLATVVSVVVTHGFGDWQQNLGTPARALLVVATLVRAPLVAGPLERVAEPGLVLVRAQVAALVTIALTSTPASTAAVLAVAGAAVLACGVLASKDSTRDAVQEAGLLTAVASAVALGWLGAGWVAGALAAGTAVHLTRVADPRGRPWARSARAVVAGGGLGAPMLAVGAALVVAASARSGPAAGLVAIFTVLGMAGRLAGVPSERREPGPSRAASVVAALSVGGALAATVVALGAGRQGWSSRMLVVSLLVAGAAAGARFAAVLAPSRPRRPPQGPAGLVSGALRPAGRVLVVAERRWSLAVAVAILAVLAASVWILAYARGFL